MSQIPKDLDDHSAFKNKTTQIRIMKQLRFQKAFIFCLIAGLSTFLSSCSDDLDEIEPVEEIVKFERFSNLSWGRADVGLLSKLNDRLYYSNINNPGFFDANGVQRQFAFRSFDMRFGHVFTEQFTVGVDGNRRSLIIIPNIDYSSNSTVFLNALNIPDLTTDYLLKPGWSEVPNFSLNDNFLISSWEKPWNGESNFESQNVFILELNSIDNGLGQNGKVINRSEPVIRKIPVDYQIDGFSMEDLISVFPFEDGWIASANIAGMQPAFFIEKNGDVTPLFNDFSRFVIFGLQQNETGELFVANEGGFYYSPSGSPYELSQLATANVVMRFRLIGDRLIVWVGMDKLFELKDYRESSDISLVELENSGLEGLQIKDVALFQGKFYVATNGGLFLKDEADFWIEKETESDPTLDLGWEFVR